MRLTLILSAFFVRVKRKGEVFLRKRIEFRIGEFRIQNEGVENSELENSEFRMGESATRFFASLRIRIQNGATMWVRFMVVVSLVNNDS